MIGPIAFAHRPSVPAPQARLHERTLPRSSAFGSFLALPSAPVSTRPSLFPTLGTGEREGMEEKAGGKIDSIDKQTKSFWRVISARAK